MNKHFIFCACEPYLHDFLRLTVAFRKLTYYVLFYKKWNLCALVTWYSVHLLVIMWASERTRVKNYARKWNRFLCHLLREREREFLVPFSTRCAIEYGRLSNFFFFLFTVKLKCWRHFWATHSLVYVYIYVCRRKILWIVCYMTTTAAKKKKNFFQAIFLFFI